jgi:hypothetical protein
MRNGKNAAVCVLFAFLLAICSFSFYAHNVYTTAGGNANLVGSVVGGFVADTGRMPYSMDELIASGYVRRTMIDGHAIYHGRIRLDGALHWLDTPLLLETFPCAYGTKKDGLVLCNGTLTDKSGKPTRLITGPYDRQIEPSLRRQYDRISRKWYSMMHDQPQGSPQIIDGNEQNATHRQ